MIDRLAIEWKAIGQHDGTPLGGEAAR